MKRLLVLLCAAALALSACSGSNAVDQGAGGGTFKFTSGSALGTLYPRADRKKAGAFSGTLLDGAKADVAAHTGKIVVLNFWASWCGPCKTELPQFDLLSKELKARGVDFVGVNTKDDRGNAQSFVQTNAISFPNIYDEQGETALRLGSIPQASLPFTVLLDKQGKVAAVYVIRLSPTDLRRALDKLLAES